MKPISIELMKQCLSLIVKLVNLKCKPTQHIQDNKHTHTHTHTHVAPITSIGYYVKILVYELFKSFNSSF